MSRSALSVIRSLGFSAFAGAVAAAVALTPAPAIGSALPAAGSSLAVGSSLGIGSARGEGSALSGGSSRGGAPQPSDPAPAPGEHLHSFNFSAVNPHEAAGGFSGIDEVAPGRYIVISDDKGEHGPVRAYRFTITDHTTFAMGDAVVFTDPQGQPYSEYMDPEEIRVLPNGNLLWTTEGNATPGRVAPPQLIESTPDGAEVRRIAVPHHHVPNGLSTRGIYHNNGPEGMAVLADGTTAVTVNEDALAQDGPRNSEVNPSRNRVTFYDLATGTPTREYVVQVEAGRGATSLLADDNGDLYMLERGFFEDLGENGENKAEIYKLDLRGATDVLTLDALTGDETPVAKNRVFDFASVRPHPDNVEGLAWGPRSEDGRRTLIVVSDDNFNETQTTYFHTLLVP
ncbi:esterase-like activity of phytase family protein [Corynebacterium timonense]|uniref:Uncharacterized conserved protein n=1 Tax=Corynebacterium timonense TaxID=441500 RepID=A0A1H1SNF5_9CORY|nr:esterase-like activity of phytase family protein [Corynebacterium timonense]SDS49530.1 Uncharacterized conserved protein [Corynebacterium timonense]